MCINLVDSVSKRKVKPLHPGSIVIDILEDRGVSQVEFCDGDYNLELDEILEGKRPVSYY